MHSNNYSEVDKYPTGEVSDQYESRYTKMENHSNFMYGVPQGQSENVSLLSNRNSYSKDKYAFGRSSQYSQLDYGQKLTANHNMLKDLLHIVDNKILSKSKVSEVKEKDSKDEVKEIEREETRKKVSNDIEVKSHKLQEKMLAVRDKLKDVITFINKEIDQKSSKKVVQAEIKSILQWSPDQNPTETHKQHKKEKSITIDTSKLDNAKEVMSREYLQSISDHGQERDYPQTMKSSLEKISQNQSAQNIAQRSEASRKIFEYQEESRQSQPAESEKTQPIYSTKMNNDKAKNFNSRKSSDQPNDLDQTGKIIYSTIKNTINKTTTAQNVNKKSEKYFSKERLQENNEINERKSYKFEGNNKKFPTLATIVSHQSLQSPNKTNSIKQIHQNNNVGPYRRKASGKFPQPQSPLLINSPSKSPLVQQYSQRSNSINKSKMGKSKEIIASSSQQHVRRPSAEAKIQENRNSVPPGFRQSGIIQEMYNKNTVQTIQAESTQLLETSSPRSHIFYQPINTYYPQAQVVQVPIQRKVNKSSPSIQMKMPPRMSNPQRTYQNSQRRPQSPIIRSSIQEKSTPFQQQIRNSNVLQPRFPPQTPNRRPMSLPRQEVIVQRRPSLNRNDYLQDQNRLRTSEVKIIHPQVYPYVPRPNTVDRVGPSINVQRPINIAQPRVLSPRDGRESRVQFVVRQNEALHNSKSTDYIRPQLKSQLSRIVEATEYSGEASGLKEMDFSRNVVDPVMLPPPHLVTSQSRSKLKKKGINVTNKSRRVFKTEY